MNVLSSAAMNARAPLLYIATAYLMSIAGGLLLASGESGGGLLFVLGPTVGVVVARTVGREGWGSAGFRFTGPQRWYWFSIALFPVVFVVVIGIGIASGRVALGAGAAPDLLLAAFLGGLIPRLLFAAFEEIGWRGFLTPALAARGIGRVRNHLLIGVVWAAWHTPFILGTPGYTDQPWQLFAPLFLAGVIAMAIILGELRLSTGSVWPAVFAHGLGGALGYALLADGVYARADNLFFGARPDAVGSVVVLWVVAAWMLAASRSRASGAAAG